MDSLQNHDELSDHASVTCPHSECSLPVLRREMEEHLQMCHSHLTSAQSGQGLSGDCNKECPKGCGLLILTNDNREHNCISELRTSIEVLRTEMMCRMEDQKKEMEAMFDMQRGHMLKKESALQDQIQALKTELNYLGDRLKMLLDMEMNRQKELERMTSERAEIMDLLSDLQKDKKEVDTICQNCLLGNKGKVTNV